MALIDDILSEYSLEELLGIRAKGRKPKVEDPLSKFLSELIRSGNASITIKVSAKNKEAVRNENGNWEENVVSYPSISHPLADLLNLPTFPETNTIPASIFTQPPNRNPLSTDLLREQLLRQYAKENLGIPEDMFLPAGYASGEELLGMLLQDIVNKMPKQTPPPAPPTGEQGLLPPPSPPELTGMLGEEAQLRQQPDLTDIIRRLQGFAQNFVV